jgi:hypothetical protein
LCQAFEVYRDLVADPPISFENLVFLVRALAEGHELELASCEECGALTVFDRITFKAHHCAYCASRVDRARHARITSLFICPNEPDFAVSRPRGKSPQQCAFFARSQRLKEESSFVASVCSLLGVLLQAGTPFNERAVANLARGELLCQAFEVYQQLLPSHGISFEHAVFLVMSLARGEELALSNWAACAAMIVLDQAAFGAPSCVHRRD